MDPGGRTDVEREREAAPAERDFLIEDGTADAVRAAVPLPPFPPLLEVEAETEVEDVVPPSTATATAAAAFPLPFAAVFAFARGLACCLGLTADAD
jgi:hypothetical protein